MSKILFVLLSIFALLSLSQANLLRSTAIQASLISSKNSLSYVSGAGYTISIYFKDSLLTRSRNLILNLYSSNMLLTENCFQFSSYACADWSACSRDTTKLYNVNYPFFTAQGNLARTAVILDNSYWALSQNAPTMISTSCAAPLTESYGAGTYGVLGMGMNGNARQNFNSKVGAFSVYYNSGSFRLEFNPDMSFAKNLIANVRTDQNWNIPNIYSIAIGTSVNYLQGVKAIFDINSDTIGLPLALFNTFLPALNTYGVYCPQGVYYKPVCSYNNALPTLYVSADAGTHIVLTPAMYALNPDGTQFTLNLRALSVNMQGLNFITQDYASTIVLGNTVLGTYYTYFNVASSTVALYQAL